LNGNQITALTTSGTGTQTVDLTASSGNVTLGAGIGSAADNLALRTTSGDLVGGAGTATAATLTLDASGGIGIGTAVTTTATSYSLTRPEMRPRGTSRSSRRGP